MEVNVLSWKDAMKKGYEPALYPFSFTEVPLGEYTALLDFKIWAKKIMAISCYFTHADTLKKFQLTVYCHNGVYRVDSSEIDFSSCPIGRFYRINVDADQKKNIVLVRPRLL